MRAPGEYVASDLVRCLAQAEGDALFWPVDNLDIKNPHAKAGLEHAEPKDLVASMRTHEEAVMRLPEPAIPPGRDRAGGRPRRRDVGRGGCAHSSAGGPAMPCSFERGERSKAAA